MESSGSLNIINFNNISMKKKCLQIVPIVAICFISLLATPAFAYSPIKFQNLDNLLGSILSTIQYYTLPVMMIILALLGIKLITSGDDTSSKDMIKGWMIKILIGGAIIYGASVLGNAIQSALI